MIYIENKIGNQWVQIGNGSRTVPGALKKVSRFLSDGKLEDIFRVGNDKSGWSFCHECDCGGNEGCLDCFGEGVACY